MKRQSNKEMDKIIDSVFKEDIEMDNNTRKKMRCSTQHN